MSKKVKSLTKEIWMFLYLGCYLSQRCLQRTIIASSYYKSFQCNNLRTPDQTRKGKKGQRDKGTKGTKGQRDKRDKGTKFQRATQALGTKKIDTTSWDKKDHTTS